MKVECSDKSIIFIDKEKGKASEGLNRFLQCTVSESFLFVCFQGEVGYTIDEKMQVDKSNYLNTYGARLVGLEAQIKMQRSM